MITRIVLLQHKRLPIRIDAVQNTNAVPVRLVLADYTIPAGSEARIYMRKPSGLEVYNNCEMENNNIIVRPTTQMYAEPGHIKAQIQIVTGNMIAASFPIWFNIAENIISSSAIESSNEIGVLDDLIKKARDAIARIEESIGQNKSYTCGITSDNGIVFKNNVGRTTLIAQVMNGTIDITDDYSTIWYKDGVACGTSRSVIVDAEDIDNKAVYKFISLDGNGMKMGECETTITNVYDGKDGAPGEPGKDGSPGIDGVDGKTSYFHIAYADDALGNGFSQYPTDKSFLGTYVDFTAADSTDPLMYNWVKIEGAQGMDGAQGIPGENGIDGETSYLHVAYAYDEFGNGFSQESSNKAYMGTYTDFVADDSTDPTRYTWVKIQGKQGEQGLQGLQGEKGDQGIPGRNGADGKTSYTHIAYANSADGTADFSVSDSNRKYIGMYVDFTATDSTDHTKYAWSLVKGADGAQGTPGKAGADGKTPYFHIAYATNDTGTAGFSTTDSTNKTYIGQYTDYAQADSTDPARYKWTKVKGEDGSDGDNGIIVSATAPSNPITGQLWQNPSTNIVKKWSGSAWVIWYLDVTNLSVENLAAIAAIIGTVSNPYTTEVESEWSNEALTGKITIGGAGIKNEYTYVSNNWKGVWRLNPQSYYTELRDTSGVLRSGVIVEPDGINFYDYSTATWVGATANTLDKMSKMFAAITVTADKQVQINSILQANTVLSGGNRTVTSNVTDQVTLNWTGSHLQLFVNSIFVGNVSLYQ